MAKVQYEDIKERLFVEVCNADKFHAELEELAYVPRENLALVYRLSGYDEESRRDCKLVTKEQMERWGVDIETLGRDAWANTRAKRPPILALCLDACMRSGACANLLNDNIPKPSCISPVDLFAITNRYNDHGAAYMFDDDTMQKAANKLGGNLYVLPSSINEVIVLVDMEGSDPDVFKDIVQSCNADSSILPENLYLSDEIYYYDSKQHTLTMVKTSDQLMSRLPDNKVSVDAMHRYGYTWDGMLPLTKERAIELAEEGLQVYRLMPNGTEGMLDTKEDIERHDGLFGVEKEQWNAYQQTQDLGESGGMVPTMS